MSHCCYETPAEIAAAIFQGDKGAEAALFKRYYSPMLAILERKTGDAEQAQDLCQEALCIMIERLRSQPLSEPDKLAGFLYHVADNLRIAEVRKSTRRKTFTNQELMTRVADRGQNQLRALMQARSCAAVRTLIAGMDNQRDRKLLYGFYIEEKDKEDLCAELDLSHRHFDKVIFRAKQRFRELLRGDDK